MSSRSEKYQLRQRDIEALFNFFSGLHFYIQKGYSSQISPYDADCELYRMKQTFEDVFPWTSKGGRFKCTNRLLKTPIPESIIKSLCDLISVITSSKSPLTIQKELNYIKTLNDLMQTFKIPAFVDFVAKKSGYSKSTVKNRLRIINAIEKGIIEAKTIQLFKSGGIFRSNMLTILSRLSRVKGKPVIKKVKKHNCGDCAVADFAALCPYCGQLIIVCHHQLKGEQENACQDFRK